MVGSGPIDEYKCRLRGRFGARGRKDVFFFEEKNQKAFTNRVFVPRDKSFLLLFFKKEVFSSYSRTLSAASWRG
jgi:hypothetical protein